MRKLTREAHLSREARTSPRAVVWVVSALAVLFALVALAVPALLSAALLVRGVGEGFPSWVALGVLSGGLWSLMLVSTLRRTGATRGAHPPPGSASAATPPRSDAPPASDPARD